MANKVKFGLKDVHIAKITWGADGITPTYGNPFAIPGAVSLTLDAEGDSADFYADNTKYFSDSTNNGYSGSLELALINEEFRTQILGQVKDRNDAFIEGADDTLAPFALGFTIDGDSSNTKYWFYNCTATRPSVSSSTIETSKSPVTDTLNIVAAARLTDMKVKADMTLGDGNATAYNSFFEQVYVQAQ